MSLSSTSALVRLMPSLNYELIFGFICSFFEFLIPNYSFVISHFNITSLSLSLSPFHLFVFASQLLSSCLSVSGNIFLYFLGFPAAGGEFMWPEKVIPGVNGVHGKGYPVPLASHEDVVKDRTLFMNTLRSFHFSLGSKFLVPVIGGKELNLHVLYVEVTRRGGYDKVVNEKRWREISSVFEFSPTTTSASYALRKHYFTLLHRYELVYFFRLQPTFLNQSGHSFQAIGTIDAKFDCGYLVSVRLGNETLNGVLYHPAGYPPASASASAHQPCNVIVPYTPQLHQQGRRARRRRMGDPGRPKPNRSGYNFFFAEKHSTLKSLYPNREREFTKMIGESWNNLPPEEREIYQSYGLKDKERYQKELKEYKERLKVLNSSMIMRRE